MCQLSKPMYHSHIKSVLQMNTIENCLEGRSNQMKSDHMSKLSHAPMVSICIYSVVNLNSVSL